MNNPTIEFLGERTGTFGRMRKRILQLDGLLTFLHGYDEGFDGSHRDSVPELTADLGFEIRELVNDSQGVSHV